jgi:DNA-nicking Smr family endonuclease
MTDDPRRRRRLRRLSDAERALWSEVTRDVAQFRPAPTGEREAETAAEPSGPAAPVPPQTRPSTPAREPGRPPALAPLGRRMRQRIARGGTAIDSRLDLHGLTQREAHGKLHGFLHAAQDRGDALVLVITGKGARGTDGEGERGVLRRQVPLWLRLPEFRGLIVGFESAHATHGGEGALYVRLRRKRGHLA